MWWQRVRDGSVATWKSEHMRPSTTHRMPCLACCSSEAQPQISSNVQLLGDAYALVEENEAPFLFEYMGGEILCRENGNGVGGTQAHQSPATNRDGMSQFRHH